MLTEKLVRRIIGDLQKSVQIKVYRDQKMLEFVKELSKIIPLEYEFEDEVERELKLPAIEIKGSNLFFHTIPKHSELETFLFALKIVSELEGEIKRSEVKILTFVSPFCPNCRYALDSINKIALKYGFEHHIIDVTLFPEIAQEKGVYGVPTTFVDKIVLRGALGERYLERLLVSSLRGEYYDYVVHKLERGEIEDLKSLEKPEIFAELMAHENFFVRLGAMALIENILKNGKKIGREAKDRIVKLLEHRDKRIREDAMMMLGMVGSKEDISLIERFLGDANLSESAREAIEMIRDRYED
uniref:Thioredoxin-like fold domain-containing protein n=1 Tax=Archaeoglobus fulgidus TaxID=2234 RepID=A0A7J2TIF4_ARCFL